METFFDGPFVVVYGDVLTDFDLSEMIRLHRMRRAAATLAILRVTTPRSAGVVTMDGDGLISGFSEKPGSRHQQANLENGGVYILQTDVLAQIAAEGPSDFGYDVFPRLLNLGLPVYGYLLKTDDYLVDIGSIEKYRQANDDVKAGLVRLPPGLPGHQP